MLVGIQALSQWPCSLGQVTQALSVPIFSSIKLVINTYAAGFLRVSWMSIHKVLRKVPASRKGYVL